MLRVFVDSGSSIKQNEKSNYNVEIIENTSEEDLDLIAKANDVMTAYDPNYTSCFMNSSDTKELFEEIEELEEDMNVTDLDKMWDGLHCLLTKESAGDPVEGNALSEAIVGVAKFDNNGYLWNVSKKSKTLKNEILCLHPVL